MAPKGLKEEIIKLRNEGHPYNYICTKLNCSKSTVAYHLNDEYRESTKERHRKNKINGDPLWHRSYKWNRRSVNVKQIREYIQDKFNNKCYLSGRRFDLNKTSSFHFDHIVPKSNGGTNELENLGVCVPEANVAKGDLSVKEFIQLCKDVLEHNGYTVKN